MFKIITIIFLLLALSLGNSIAQENNLLKYIGHDMKYTQASELFGVSANGRYNINSSDIEVYSSRTAKFLLDRDLHKNISGVRVIVRDTDLTATVERLKNFPSLQFISFPGTLSPNFGFNKFILPDNINQLKQLQGVEITYPDANLSEIIPKLKNIKKLSAISISSVKKSLPKELLDIKHIRSIGLNSINIRDLDISNALWENVFYDGSSINITQLDADLTKLSELRQLKHLELFACNFGNDLSLISKFQHLKSFKISGTTFGKTAQLFHHLTALQNLQTLSIRFVKDSTQTLDGLEKLKTLRHLTIEDMSSMKIIPVTIGDLSKLKTLTIFTCPIKELTLSVFQLPDLERLELSTPQLAVLPDGDFKCKKLKSISISYAKLSSIPNALTSLTRLEKIHLMGNQINKIPKTGWEKLIKLKEIDLSNNRLTVFPGGLQQIVNLLSLGLAGNQIDNMPDLSGSNYKLTVLDLSRNKLKALPDHIGKYDQLQMLSIGHNMFTTLPSSLGNCSKLEVFDAEARYTYMLTSSMKDTVSYLKALPDGLKNTPALRIIKLTGNKGIDATSVFNVVTSMTRPNLVVELSGTDISAIPSNPDWKNANIARMELSFNKLTTLPAELITAKKIGAIGLYSNSFPGTAATITTGGLQGKSDLKVLYSELGVPFPDSAINKREYAASLSRFANGIYNGGSADAKVIQYCDQALAADSAAYFASIDWEVIGACRYRAGNYTGALADFEHFIAKQSKRKDPDFYGLRGRIEYYKAEAYIKLGQLAKAAQTHEFFARRFDRSGAMQSAAIIYKEMGQWQRYTKIMDSVMALQLNKIELAKKKNNEVGIAILDHAETLIIAGRQSEAIKLMDYRQTSYSSYNYNSIKEYLLATVNYLNEPTKFEQLKSALTAYFKTHEKVLYWNFDMFNNWVTHVFKDPVKQAQIMELEEISKYK